MEDGYLFKAKRVDNGKWVKGYFVQTVESSYIVVPYKHSTICGEGSVIEIDKSTICQCTGLKDKNGKMIWENDIIIYRDCTEEKYVIAWEQNKACFEYQQYSCSMMNFDELSGCEVEVIGNIFDNQELLESEG